MERIARILHESGSEYSREHGKPCTQRPWTPWNAMDESVKAMYRYAARCVLADLAK